MWTRSRSEEAAMYLMWQDLSKRAAREKVAAAVEAYREKHGRDPREIVVNAEMAAEIGEAEVAFPLLVRNEVQRGVVYVGDNE